MEKGQTFFLCTYRTLFRIVSFWTIRNRESNIFLLMYYPLFYIINRLLIVTKRLFIHSIQNRVLIPDNQRYEYVV